MLAELYWTAWILFGLFLVIEIPCLVLFFFAAKNDPTIEDDLANDYDPEIDHRSDDWWGY